MNKFFAAVLAGAALALSAPVFAQTALPSFAPVIKRASPAVVNIGVKGTVAAPRNPFFDDPGFRRFFGLPPDAQQRDREFRSAGSGVIVDAKNGYIVTNAHVVQNASEITDHADRRRRAQGRSRRRRRPLRRRGAQGQGREAPRRDAPGRFLEAPGRRLRDRDRQPVRPSAHGDLGHRQRARPHRHQPRRPRGLHPDRRRDQPGQFRRRAGRPRRRPGRHQFRDPVAERRQHRHRLRDPLQHGPLDHGAADRVRARQSRPARRDHAVADAGIPQEPRARRERPGRARLAGDRGLGGGARPASRSAT